MRAETAQAIRAALSIFPEPYKPFQFPLAQQIISDWLVWEISQHGEEVYPLLREIAGWRRHEIMAYCESQRDIWDARIAQSYA